MGNMVHLTILRFRKFNDIEYVGIDYRADVIGFKKK